MDFNFSKYKLVIKYTVNSEEHDGYCSDPDDIETKTYVTRKFMKVPDDLKNLELYDKNLHLKDLNLIEKYNKSFPHGNGHCGCSTKMRATSAKLYKHNPFHLK